MMHQARAILEAASGGLRSAGRLYLGPDLSMQHSRVAFGAKPGFLDSCGFCIRLRRRRSGSSPQGPLGTRRVVGLFRIPGFRMT